MELFIQSYPELRRFATEHWQLLLALHIVISLICVAPGKDPVPIVEEAGWAPGSVWAGAENLAPHRDSIPGPSSP